MKQKKNIGSLFILLILFFSCSNNNSSKYFALQEDVEKSNDFKLLTRKFIQYKIITYKGDTISPNENCYIILKNESVYYYKENNLFEKYRLIQKKQYNYPFYFLENSPDHILSIDTINNIVRIYRFGYEGDVEIFRFSSKF